MARVTIEDCIKHVNNRFALVALATQYAKEIKAKGRDSYDPNNPDIKPDKPPVIALRDIANKRMSIEALENRLLLSLKTNKFRSDALDEEQENYADEDKSIIDYLPNNIDVVVTQDFSSFDSDQFSDFLPFEEDDDK
jgi:DNA-directed RNA polymerase subunit omega